jgi:hypothetical protein
LSQLVRPITAAQKPHAQRATSYRWVRSSRRRHHQPHRGHGTERTLNSCSTTLRRVSHCLVS